MEVADLKVGLVGGGGERWRQHSIPLASVLVEGGEQSIP